MGIPRHAMADLTFPQGGIAVEGSWDELSPAERTRSCATAVRPRRRRWPSASPELLGGPQALPDHQAQELQYRQLAAESPGLACEPVQPLKSLSP